jgi:hypothetical protein
MSIVEVLISRTLTVCGEVAERLKAAAVTGKGEVANRSENQRRRRVTVRVSWARDQTTGL